MQELFDQLREDPSNLKEVYLQSRKLERWRNQLLEDIKKMHSRAAAASDLPRSKGKGSQEASLSTATYERILSVVGEYLASVRELSEVIRQQLWKNIENCYELAENEPALLVMTLEIIELQELCV